MKPDALPPVTSLPASASAVVGRNGLNTRVMPTAWPPMVRVTPDPDPWPEAVPPTDPEHADTAITAAAATANGIGHRLAFLDFLRNIRAPHEICRAIHDVGRWPSG
jgi:hypothetical protein